MYEFLWNESWLGHVSLRVVVIVQGQPTMVNTRLGTRFVDIVIDALRQTVPPVKMARKWNLRDVHGLLMDLNQPAEAKDTWTETCFYLSPVADC